MTRVITLTGYAVLVALLIACEVIARRTGRFATLGRTMAALARWRASRFLLLGGWLWVGWHVFVRAHR